jgi:hypothetical protein
MEVQTSDHARTLWVKEFLVINKKISLEEKDQSRAITNLKRSFVGIDVETDKEARFMRSRQEKEHRLQLELISK